MNDNFDTDDLSNPYASPLASEHAAEIDVIDQAEELRPFRSIWFRPRATIRRIVAESPERHVLLLVCGMGIARALDRASLRNMGDNLPLPVLLGIILSAGPLGGMFSVWLGSHLIRLSGEWIGVKVRSR